MGEIYLKRDFELEQMLGKAFKKTYLLLKREADGKNKQNSLNELYSAGENVQGILLNKDPEGYDNDLSNLLLKESIGLTHQLHDKETRDVFIENPEKLEKYAAQLLGETPVKYERQFNGSKMEILYLPNRTQITIYPS